MKSSLRILAATTAVLPLITLAAAAPSFAATKSSTVGDDNCVPAYVEISNDTGEVITLSDYQHQDGADLYDPSIIGTSLNPGDKMTIAIEETVAQGGHGMSLHDGAQVMIKVDGARGDFTYLNFQAVNTDFIGTGTNFVTFSEANEGTVQSGTVDDGDPWFLYPSGDRLGATKDLSIR